MLHAHDYYTFSVPIRGLFNLTLYLKQQMLYSLKMPLTAEIVNRPQIAL